MIKECYCFTDIAIVSIAVATRFLAGPAAKPFIWACSLILNSHTLFFGLMITAFYIKLRAKWYC